MKERGRHAAIRKSRQVTPCDTPSLECSWQDSILRFPRGSARTRFLGLVDDVVQHASAGAAGVQRCAARHPDALRTADGGAQRLIASVMLAATVRIGRLYLNLR